MNSDILELEFPYERCPHCNEIVINDIDPEYSIETIDKGTRITMYGSQDYWKDVYECPYCHKRFFIEDTYDY